MKTVTEILASDPETFHHRIGRRLRVGPGRIVRYVLESGELRPAMIVDAPSETSEVVDLLVFGKKSDGIAGFVERLDVARSDAPEPGKWHWSPDYVKDLYPKRAKKQRPPTEAKA